MDVSIAPQVIQKCNQEGRNKGHCFALRLIYYEDSENTDRLICFRSSLTSEQLDSTPTERNHFKAIWKTCLEFLRYYRKCAADYRSLFGRCGLNLLELSVQIKMPTQVPICVWFHTWLPQNWPVLVVNNTDTGPLRKSASLVRDYCTVMIYHLGCI